MENTTIGIFMAFGLSFFFLYTRHKTWVKPKLRWLICGCLLVVGILGLIKTNHSNKEIMIFYWELCVPAIYLLFDRFFRWCSFKLYNRDFILWLRHSDQINDSLNARNPHVQIFDKVFSVGLLIIIISSTCFVFTLF